MHVFLKTCKFAELAELSSLEIAAMLIASAAHDYEHPYFLIKKGC